MLVELPPPEPFLHASPVGLWPVMAMLYVLGYLACIRDGHTCGLGVLAAMVEKGVSVATNICFGASVVLVLSAMAFVTAARRRRA